MKGKKLTFLEFAQSIKNIDRACSSVFENSISIFLPFRRIDKTAMFKLFCERNQVLEIKTEIGIFNKVEVRARLLGQLHKDILENLLSVPKVYNPSSMQFSMKITAYQLLKMMNKNTSNKKWLIEKIEEIAECRIKLFYKNNDELDETYSFAFIDSIRIIDNKNIEISFSQAYTYFLAKNQIIDYKDYIPLIMGLESNIKKIQKELGLSRAINVEFIKAIVRYMLMHKGNNSQIRLTNLAKKLNLNNIMTTREIEENMRDLKRVEIQKIIKDNFGLSLVSDNQTLKYNKQNDKNKFILGTNLI